MQRKWRRAWSRDNSVTERPNSGPNPLQAVAKRFVPPLIAAGIMLSSLGVVHAGTVLPTGGAIVNGNGTITVNGNTMTINQYTAKMIANWQSFSIGSDGIVNFIQPDSQSVALNRVLGNDASYIYGHLNANGQVFLINPNGVVFAKGAQVNVGGLTASTLDLSDSDFLDGKYRFSQKAGKVAGSVLNQGTITTANGGYVALIGTDVRNEGAIVAQKGTVALASGKTVTIDVNGDGLLNLAVNTAAVDGGVANAGLLAADGGQVVMTASAAGALARTVVNNSGIIQARTLDNKNGVIRLDGGTSGTVVNSGTLDASGKAAGQTGGTVKVLGETVNLGSSSKIDVAGDKGGGTVLVGGNFKGKGPEQNATNTTVEKGASINADAITSGNGGNVAVWSNDKTVFNGSISAKGGSKGGNGGQVETSGHKLKIGDTASVVTLAAKGKTGNWLLDPYDFTIAASGGDMTGATLSAALENSDVSILIDGWSGTTVGGVPGTTTGTGTSGTGVITVDDTVHWNSGHTLTLDNSMATDDWVTFPDMKIYKPIIAPNGGLTLSSNGLINCTAPIDIGTFNLWGKWRQVATELPGGVLPGFSAKNFVLSSGSFLRVLGGDGSGTSPYQLADVYMLQAIGFDGLLNQNFVLANDIDASVTKSWNAGQGFKPLGGDRGSYVTAFTGTFDGGGHAISNLYINSLYDGSGSNGPNMVGLFAQIGPGGTVRNLRLVNVDITGTSTKESDDWQSLGSDQMLGRSYYVGGLAGAMDSGTIDNVQVTGKVTGNQANAVGGLAGLVLESRTGNHDSVVNSASAAAVTANGVGRQIAAGGLIGELDYNSKLRDTWTVPNSTDSNYVRNSYSSGPVTVNNTGLAGVQHGTYYAGGLVGLSQGGSIAQSYSTGNVTVNSTDAKSTVYAGGLAGASWDNAYTIGPATYSPVAPTSIYTGEKITDSYSSGKVSYSGDKTHVGGFVGANSGAISQSFWDTGRSGQTKGVGSNSGKPLDLKGLTTAQMVAQSSFGGWKFSGPDAVWYMIDGYTTPFLRSEYSTRITNPHQLQLMAMNPAATYTLAADLDMRGYNMAPGVGFVPVSTFSGQFDGQGHTISYLTIHDYNDDVGLFGRTADGAAIHDVALANAAIAGGAAANTGIVAGYNAAGSRIYNTFTGGTVSGDGNVGGSAGSNAGTLATSFSAAKVTGSAATAGGLAGANSGDISESYLDAASSVNGGTGNLAGSNTGTIAVPTYDLTNGNWVRFGSNQPVLAWTVAPDGTIGLYTASQLQQVNGNVNGSYRLRADLDLTGLNWTPIGTTGGSAFSGKLDGGGYGIDHLTVSSSPYSAIGLFGYTNGAVLSNLTLTNVNIAGGTGNTYVGGLVGYSQGGSISNVTVSGTVAASDAGANAGGVAGYNSGGIIATTSAAAVTATGAGSSAGGIAGVNAAGGSIKNSSHTTGEVKTVNATNSFAGGIAGQNAGLIANSFNSGDVTVSGTGAASQGSSAGGVAGYNSGTIGSSDGAVYNRGAVTTAGDSSYAGGIAGQNAAGGIIGFQSYNAGQGTVYNTGRVTALGAGSKAGGVAGANAGDITSAYAAAVVTAQGPHSYVGGLVGDNRGSIRSAYFGALDSGYEAKVVSIGEDNRVGGIAGANSGSIADTMGFGVVSSAGPVSYVGGLIGDNSGSLATSYNLGEVTGTPDSFIGALIGRNSGSVTDAAWCIESVGLTRGVGTSPDGTDAGTGLTYDQLFCGTSTSWSGWGNFYNWKRNEGNLPTLSWMLPDGRLMLGRMVDGGSGVAVDRYTNGWVSGTIQHYQTHTFGHDGLFIMNPAGTTENTTGAHDAPSHVMLLTAKGTDYKANAIYPEMPSGTSFGVTSPVTFYDLKKNTLIAGVPWWTSNMPNYNSYFGFNFYRLFGEQATSPVVAALADSYPDLMFTAPMANINAGDWHDPGSYYERVYLYNLDVQGNFEAKNIHLYEEGSNQIMYITGASITTHKMPYANGDIIVDNSQMTPKGDFSWPGYTLIYDTDRLFAVQGQASKYNAAGNISIKENGNFVIGAGSGEPLITAGGDIDITCPGLFINWGGPNAIQAGAGGSYRIYAQDMLTTNWLESADPSSQRYWAALANLQRLFYGGRYLDRTYEINMALMDLNDQLVYDTRGGLAGFTVFGYKPGDTLPAGSGFIYTRQDPYSAAGIQERPWMTPDYFATQQRRQWAADVAQAGGSPANGAASSAAAGADRSDNLVVNVVDGGVALPTAAHDTNKGKE